MLCSRWRQLNSVEQCVELMKMVVANEFKLFNGQRSALYKVMAKRCEGKGAGEDCSRIR